MTEQQWLASTDPAAMYNFIKDRVTERQQRFFVKACRSLCAEWQYVGEDYYSAAFSAWCTGLAYRSPALEVRADILREIIGNPFRPMRWYEEPLPGCIVIVPMDCVILDPAWLTWNNATVPNLIRSMMEEECEQCLGTGGGLTKKSGPFDNDRYKRYMMPPPETCHKCNGKRYVPRAEPQWEMMLIIADALESAGCTEAAILDHLRGTEPCHMCHRTGMSLLGNCKYCNGTGKRPVRHVKGCWVIELLKE